MKEKTDKPEPELQVTDGEKEQERAEERALFARYKSDPANPRLEQELVERFTPLVYKIVHRFKYAPDQFNDLVQVGLLGLLHGVRRFEPDKNFRFSTFAWQTIQGEIQRYFRDKTWAVNVPRDLKERSLKVFNVREEIARATGQDPTVAELADRVRMTEEQVQEAMELGSAYHPQSFDLDNRGMDYSYAVVSNPMGSDGQDMTGTRRSIFWENLFDRLDESEAEILRMYFFSQRTQKEIADSLCTSQMNVSRLMRKALGKLRKMIAPEDIDNLGML